MIDWISKLICPVCRYQLTATRRGFLLDLICKNCIFRVCGNMGCKYDKFKNHKTNLEYNKNYDYMICGMCLKVLR